jgi:hypothetical protein
MCRLEDPCKRLKEFRGAGRSRTICWRSCGTGRAGGSTLRVPPVYAAIDRQLRELEAGALIMARGAGAQRVYAIADRGSDMLAALAHDIGER